MMFSSFGIAFSKALYKFYLDFFNKIKFFISDNIRNLEVLSLLMLTGTGFPSEAAGVFSLSL